MTGEQKEKFYNSITAIDDKFIEEAALENEEIQPESASGHILAASAEESRKTEKKAKSAHCLAHWSRHCSRTRRRCGRHPFLHEDPAGERNERPGFFALEGRIFRN